MIFDDCTVYDDCEPAGVELPKTIVKPSKLKEIGLSSDSSTKEILYELARKGLREKGITKYSNKDIYFQRTKQELETFEELGFTDYILLNWDVLNFCHDNKIPTGAGRGSAAGSLVLYLLGVTNIDPIPNSLFFERFVSKSRAKKVLDRNGKEFLVGSLLPDVDSDISYDQRHKVISYIEKQHEGKTAKILTFNTFSSKLCIKEAAKYFDEASEERAMRISDSIPKLHGQVLPLETAFLESDKFTEWARKNPHTYKNALKVQGLPKNTGVHPSGIAICSQKISDVVPLQKTKDGDLVTGYNMDDVADLMVKFDILGLRTLTIAHKCCEKVDIDIDDIDPNDDFIYEKLQDFKHPAGLFQISAETNYRVCKDVKPENLTELSDVIALARPAALEHVQTYIEQKRALNDLNLHPELDKILSWSKNVILFQEQIMQIANKVFGFTLEEAETLRRIVGKKKVDQMPQWRKKIFDAAEEKGLDERVAEFYWVSLEASAHYSFNKSHSFAYADLAAKTVYLKYKYPQEFFLSILECSEFEPDPLETISLVSQELKSFKINLLPPCLYKSDFDFKIEGRDIRYGLRSIKGVSDKNLKSLIDFRGFQFNNRYEIFIAAKECGIPINVLSSLIQAGLMDNANEDSSERVSRSKLVLQAQSFNLLTDREKRNFSRLSSRLGFNILKAIQQALFDKVLADDGKVLIKESRFNTFRSKYNRYRDIYTKNKDHEKFASWTFENSLLGFSYSYDLKSCFEDDPDVDNLYYLSDVEDLSDKTKFSSVCLVKDFFTKESQAGNKYMIMTLSDNTATKNMMFIDGRGDDKFSEFMRSNKLKKSDVVHLTASKSNNTIFIDKLEIKGPEIYMYKRQVKK
tara:strand:+ start:5252 stop:7834 length:2583 start_codon:yes stop_codon:yes gene_type:complete